jgi:hypothetical protein
MVTQYIGVIVYGVKLHYLQRIEISKILNLTIAIHKFFRLQKVTTSIRYR